jgi:hypothetical protein
MTFDRSAAPEGPESLGVPEAPEIPEAATPGGAQALDDAEALQLVSGASAAAVQWLLAEFGSLPQVLAAAPAALRRRPRLRRRRRSPTICGRSIGGES